jgi:site-specific recombinase XerD
MRGCQVSRIDSRQFGNGKNGKTLETATTPRRTREIAPSNGQIRRRYRWTPELDAVLLHIFESETGDLKRALEKISRLRPEWPSSVFARRARRFGLYRRRPHRKKKWTDVQVEYLRENVGSQHDSKIAERVGHSRKAVRDKIRAEGLGSARVTEGYSIHQVCKDLNVSHHTVSRFVRNNWLTIQGGRITEESYRRLCRMHADELNWQSLTEAEVERLFRAVDESEIEVRKRNRALTYLLLEAGIRSAEIMALQPSDIQLHRPGLIRVFAGKSELPREIQITETLFPVLRDHIAANTAHALHVPLFSDASGQPLRAAVITEVLADIGKNAKIFRIRVSPTILRHTFAERFLRLKRGNVIELHDLLGNASLQTTFIYARRCGVAIPAETHADNGTR